MERIPEDYRLKAPWNENQKRPKKLKKPGLLQVQERFNKSIAKLVSNPL